MPFRMTNNRFSFWSALALYLFVYATGASLTPPQLNGAHFRITVVEETGFLDINESSDGAALYSGYLIDMLKGLSQPSRANFTYDLLPPSGYGPSCNPRLERTASSNSTYHSLAYDQRYHTQYNCGSNDVTEDDDHSTDMYLGMFYVTPQRRLTNQFTISFSPPFSGTLTMFGTATGVSSFEALAEQQAAGLQSEACAPAGTALINFVEIAIYGLKVKGILGGEEEIYEAFVDGTCDIFITDNPVAAQYILRLSRRDKCLVRGAPMGVIGEPMNFGPSQYAIGIREDIPREVEDTLSYWINVLMTCSPLDPESICPDGNLASFYDGQGGTGDECGYVLYPPGSGRLGVGMIILSVVGPIIFVIGVGFLFHRLRLDRQDRLYAKRSKAALEEVERERKLNEFIAHEVRNPLASAIAALSFVSSKTSDATVIANSVERDFVNSDIAIINSSLQFVNELLRNLLDSSADKEIALNIAPTDVLRDVFEPVTSILFMRGAKVDVITECPSNLVVETDRMRLKQILLNLAANATKFVETGFIRLRAEVVENNVYMHVEDSGPGIPSSKREHLFGKFQESLDLLNQGTGVGLSVCKKLSEQMKADLFLDEHFDSAVAGCPGTRFSLRMNLAPIPVEPRESFVTERLEDLSGSSLDLPERLSVLFVDDDMILRKLFSRTIRRIAPTWVFQEASNGETALRLAESESFDLIFMDQHMASIEKQLLGTETVRLLRAKGAKSLICGLSANNLEEQFRDAGANGFMLKPFPCEKSALRLELIRLLFPDKSSVPEQSSAEKAV